MLNPYIAQLLTECDERFSIDALNMTYSEWICRNTSMLGRPFSFKGYEFQRQIADDMHPELDCIKISQVGLTEVQIRKMLAFLVRNRGTKGIFSLSDENMFERISNQRVKPIVEKDKVFNTKYDKENKATRSQSIKQFKQSFLNLVAAVESAATSIDADIVFNDEVDLSDQSMIGLFSSRLQGSKFRIQQRFSTPSFPGFGIDANYSVSDQHVYMCRCDGCGEWNDPEFNFEYIFGIPRGEDLKSFTDLTEEQTMAMDLTQAYVGCQKCQARLDLGNAAKRQWVCKYPSRKHARGYRVSPFATTMLDIPYIIKQLHKYQKQNYIRGFHNTVLGKAYSDDTIQVSEEQVRACFTQQVTVPSISPYEDVFIGIDVGKVCHVVVGKGKTADDIIEIMTVPVIELIPKVKELCKKYRVRAGAIDRHPYEPTANEVFVVSGGRIIPVEYRGKKDINIVKNDYDQVTHAQVNRTWFLDNLVTRIRKKSITISGYQHHKEVFISHMRAMARNESPEKEAEWTKLNENDHYFHAAAFMVVAPQIADLIKLKSNADIRSMVFGVSTTMTKTAENLIGVGPKRVDNPLVTR